MASAVPFRLTVAALLLATVAPVASAQKISLSELNTQLSAAVERRFEKEHKGKEEVNKVSIKQVSVTAIRAAVPAPKIVWFSDELRPYINCSDTPQSVKQSVTTTVRDEVTFDQRFHITATVSMEIGGSSGVVSGSISAGVEAGMERGEQQFNGTESSVSQDWEQQIPPRTGYWVGPTGRASVFSKLPFEMDVEVRKVKLQYNPKGPKGNTTTEVDWSKNPLKAVANGTFSAFLPASKPGLSQIAMTAAEMNEACAVDPNAPRTVAARKPVGVGKQVKKVTHGMAVPATFSAVDAKR